jgi:hypothetical protein
MIEWWMAALIFLAGVCVGFFGLNLFIHRIKHEMDRENGIE